MNKYALSYLKEEEKAEEIISFYFYELLNRYIGPNWQTKDIVEGRIRQEETGGDKYDEKIITFYIDGVPKLRLNPAYEPKGYKILFTMNPTYL